jgi:hypothetical protein
MGCAWLAERTHCAKDSSVLMCWDVGHFDHAPQLALNKKTEAVGPLFLLSSSLYLSPSLFSSFV